MNRVKLSSILFVFVYLLIPRTVDGSTTPPFRNEFQRISWDFQKILDVNQVPPPNSAPNSSVHSIYAPSVIKYNQTYYLVFGVAVYCGVYRDSIALAQSTDGINFTFTKYLIEPDPRSCQIAHSTWPTGMLYQTNGPELQVIRDNGVDRFFLFHDSVLWKTPIINQTNENPIECNNIALAIYDNSFNLLSHNLLFLPTTTENCQNTIEGYKTPAIQWLSEDTTKLWFDKLGTPGSTTINSLSQLPQNSVIIWESFSGGDLNLPNLSYTEELVLYGWGSLGKNIEARSRKKGESSWSEPWIFLPFSGQTWDQERQGSPSMLLEKDSCKIKLYYSGNHSFASHTVDNQALSIGVAIPNANQYFSFPTCTPKPGDLNRDNVVDLNDFNLLISYFGTQFNLIHFNDLISNYGSTY